MTEPLSQLLQRCSRREPDALQTLVARLGPAGRSLAIALLGDEHAAEDAVQAAFIVMLDRLGQLREPQALAAWFRQIVRSQAMRILRRRSESLSPTAGHDQPDRAAGPDESAQSRELQVLMREAVRRLPPANQQAAEMFYFDQRSLSQIAGSLGVPAGTVKRRLHDARQRLRDMLLGYVNDGTLPGPPAGPPWQLPL